MSCCPWQQQGYLRRLVVGGCVVVADIGVDVSPCVACCGVSPTGAACCYVPLAVAACCCVSPIAAAWWHIWPIATLTCVSLAMAVACAAATFLRCFSVQTDGACPPPLVLRSAPGYYGMGWWDITASGSDGDEDVCVRARALDAMLVVLCLMAAMSARRVLRGAARES